MNISDVIDLFEVKAKVERLLLELKDDEIDIFFSPGTSTMQIAWYICHTSLSLKSKLFQTRPPRFTKSKVPELLEISIEPSILPYTATIIESNSANINDDYLISNSIKPVYDKAVKIAQADGVTLLISGETGTGKEHLANFVHEHSPRKQKPFIVVNCSSMQDQLLESRLFGYKKGAFTGAEKDQKGLFEEADGGTIFLDEIGDITAFTQQSLLRVLQQKEIQPIGGISKKVDVRIICATHRNLALLCEKEAFRWDLYYRLTVTELHLPALRERTQSELSELINHFLAVKRTKFKRKARLTMEKPALEFLLQYRYPGNIRELENLIESMYVYNDDSISINSLPSRIHDSHDNLMFNWKHVEKNNIESALRFTGWNKSAALKLLKYKSINTLISKIKEYEIIQKEH